MLSKEISVLLENLSEEEKQAIIKDFPNPLSFKKGDVIYSADKFSNALGFVIRGKAFAVTNNSQALFMQSFKDGDIFGAAAIFGGEEFYVSTIIAKSDIEVLFISEEALKNMFIKYPQTALNYISFLSERIRFLNKKLSLISCGNAEDTVLNYLRHTAQNDGFAYIPSSKTTLAKMLNLSRASLYRAFDNLEQDGLIKRENNKIKVIKNEKNS